MPTLIDSHCHLTYPGLYERIDEVLANAAAAGVAECITIATDLDDAARAIELSATHPGVRVAAGIHPHEAAKAPEQWDRRLAEIVARPDVYAVGEMGLDYHYDLADRPSQRRVFRRQLELATEAMKPVVIHCRESHADTLAELADFPALRGVVFHCFTGTLREAEEILARGHWLSLTGIVTFKNSNELREVARILPDDRLMVETDAPYLSPIPVRAVKPNEPAHVVHTAACIAAERGVTLDALARLATNNTRRFFNLPC